MIIKAEFKNFIDLTSTVYDNKIDLIVAGVNSFVQKYCANILIKEAVTEYFDSDEILNDESNIYLTNRVNIADLVISYNTGTESVPVWVEEARANYVPYLKEGRIKLDTVRDGERNYKVVYNAGYDLEETDEDVEDVPDDLKLGCLKLAGAFYNKSKSEGESSEGLDGASVNFAGSLTPEIKSLLSNYRTRNI